ncbi:glycoside hydrolase superfamily [Trichoderma pleuroticola]
MATMQRQDLATGWKWRLANSNNVSKAGELDSLREWHPTTSFPSVIQQELLAIGSIPDPNIGLDERLIQWVGAADWEYSCSFPTPEGAGTDDSAVDLVFEGLDTFATVVLNGKEILRSDNMFLPHRVSCHWGWDWGPIILTAGPYLPIYLETYSARVDKVHITSDLDTDHSSASISIDVQAVGLAARDVRINIIDAASDALEVNSKSALIRLDTVSKSGSAVVCISNPKLWWPNGQGAQHLYRAAVTLLDSSSNVLHETKIQFGVRTIKLIQRPLDNAPGTTFLFNVNGRDIFCQGGNWIPADNLTPRISREKYFDWIRLAKYNHVNMIRVWGGGMYGTEDFFDACDEMGMLVWQDYAFACGDCPMQQEYLESVSREAEAQTLRLRNRASLALLCGGNEDFLLHDWFHVEYDYADHKGPFEDQPFPQRKIFLQLLPEICKRLCPEVQYWPSSPWGEQGKNSLDPNFGDLHQWGVWHLEQKPYQQYKDLSGRFVSEFGMHGFPVMRTLEGFTPDAADRFPQSRVIDCHNKAHGAETRIARYLAENFRYDMRIENYVYCSHLMQSEAYGYALRDWKRKFDGRGREECAGLIIWQLNDIYPCTSWAYIDYYLRPKPAFYTIRRTFAPISVGIERTPLSRWIDEDHPRESEKPTFTVFAHNTNPKEVECRLHLQAFDFQGSGRWAALDWEDKQVTLNAGYNTELGTVTPHSSWTEESLIILEASLVDDLSGSILARFVNWPEPYRYLQWPADTEVSVSVEDGDTDFEHRVTVVANHPVKGCWLEPVYDGMETIDSREPLWEDNMFDLMPGHGITVGVNGLNGRTVRSRFLGDWELTSL